MSTDAVVITLIAATAIALLAFSRHAFTPFQKIVAVSAIWWVLSIPYFLGKQDGEAELMDRLPDYCEPVTSTH